MKKYLSSYKIGDEAKRLKNLFGENKNIAYISNALDCYSDGEKRRQHEKSDMKNLEELGLDVELLDLRVFFGKREKLKERLAKYAGVFISGGNVFVLNQVYMLSGFGEIMQEYSNNNSEFIYAGYSAGVCVLSPSLDGYHIVDDAKIFPYTELQKQVWKGLGIIDFSFSPHYNSDHPESKLIDKVIEYCIQNKIIFKALKDGEVLVIE